MKDLRKNNNIFDDELPADFQGSLKWQSPSNIALVKYWGKRGRQLPHNPSVSFTLSECRTETSATFHKADCFGLHFHFEGKEHPAFAAKIEKYLLENLSLFPFLSQLDLCLESRNTFPHSSGIASSASSMSALVLCLLDIERQAIGACDIDWRKASYCSRLASGSACRSVFPTMALWGATDYHQDSSDEYAIPLNDEIHPVFKTYHDSILLVSDAVKTVSSRAGHTLMDGNPYAETRYRQAKHHTQQLLAALKSGDLEAFIRITEAEALQLHALMMCSSPSFILMKTNTLRIIEEVRLFREETKIPVCFTLDAGPNVHLLYPDDFSDEVKRFIVNILESYCADSRWIADHVGEGPSRL